MSEPTRDPDQIDAPTTDSARSPRSGGKRGIVPLLVMAAVVVALGLGLYWFLAGRDGGSGSDGDDAAGGPSDPTLAVLYFPAGDGFLYREERRLPAAETPRERVRQLVEALLAGPETLGLSSPYPEEVGLIDVYLGRGGTAFVDLGAEAMENPPPGGSLEEMMMVYSVIDTVVENVPEVRQVALLWNGAQRESFTGHLDTSRPLGPKMDLVADGAR